MFLTSPAAIIPGRRESCVVFHEYQATSCALIVNELIQNAVDHGLEHRSEGHVVVRLLQTDDSMSIEIEDDGKGLPEGFDPARGGLGLQIIRTLVRDDLKGQFLLEDGDGVRAVVSFPRWRPPRNHVSETRGGNL